MANSGNNEPQPLCENCLSLEAENSRLTRMVDECREVLDKFEAEMVKLILEKHRCQEAIRDLGQGMRDLEVALDNAVKEAVDQLQLQL